MLFVPHSKKCEDELQQQIREKQALYDFSQDLKADVEERGGDWPADLSREEEELFIALTNLRLRTNANLKRQEETFRRLSPTQEILQKRFTI